jgi:muconolactone delta-isomerase
MVILTGKQGVTRQQIMNVIPAEIRATVRLYLDGKIRQWYSKGDGRGVVLFLDVKSVDEAHAIIDAMPLSKENLVDHEYIAVGPLLPLATLIGGGPTQQ